MNSKSTRSFRAAMIAACGLALVAGGALYAAGPDAKTAISTRQANFKKMGGAMKTIKDQLGGGSPSKDAIVAAAKTIATTARVQPQLFPAGSGASAGVKTDALATIWTQRATFDTQGKALVTEADKLLKVAQGGDFAAIRAQYGAVGKTCGACHKQFRADD